MLSDNKENVNMEGGGGSVKENIKGKMTEEQDLLRVGTQCPPHTYIEWRGKGGGSVKEYMKVKMTKEQDLLRATHTHKDKHILSGGNEGRGG